MTLDADAIDDETDDSERLVPGVIGEHVLASGAVGDEPDLIGARARRLLRRVVAMQRQEHTLAKLRTAAEAMQIRHPCLTWRGAVNQAIAEENRS